MKSIIIPIEIYKANLMVIYDCSSHEFADKVNKYDKEENLEWMRRPNNSDGAYIHANEYPYRFVWVEKINHEPYWLGVLAHELTHASIRILNDKGVPVVPSSYTNEDESLSYLMDYLIKKTMEGYKKKKNAKKRKRK